MTRRKSKQSSGFGKSTSEAKPTQKLEVINIIATSFFSLMLLIVTCRQCSIDENANKLAQYQYRFEFYKDVEELQKEISFQIEETAAIEIPSLTADALSIMRASSLLFTSDVYMDVESITNEHITTMENFINEKISFEEYQKRLVTLVRKYGEFMRSEAFINQVNINKIS